MTNRRLTGDLIRLSDAFRRGATFDNAEAARTLVAQGRTFSILMTYFRGEDPGMPENRRLARNMAQHISEMAVTAKGAGLGKLVLPLALSSRQGDVNPSAVWLRDQVLPQQKFPVRIEFQKDAYRTDLSRIGRIDPSINTLLDMGVRGISDIDSSLKYKWSREGLSPV